MTCFQKLREIYNGREKEYSNLMKGVYNSLDSVPEMRKEPYFKKMESIRLFL